MCFICACMNAYPAAIVYLSKHMQYAGCFIKLASYFSIYRFNTFYRHSRIVLGQNYFVVIDIYVHSLQWLTTCVPRPPLQQTRFIMIPCIYGKMTCTVKEGLYSTRSQTILNLICSYVLGRS